MNETQNTQSTCMAWLQATPFRKNITTLIFVFIALALIAKTVLLFRQASHVGQGDNYPQSITVTGKSEMFVKPDTLQFTVSVNEDGKDVAEATAKATEKISQAIAILKANGVEEKNIKTTNWTTSDKYESVSQGCAVSVTSQYAPSMRPAIVPPPCITASQIVGATVYQTLEVKIRDIDTNATVEKRGKLVAELAQANIKTEGFVFTVFDLDEVKKQVREEAIAKAKADAKMLARQLGVSLPKVIGFSEQDAGYNPYMSARADMVAGSKEASMVPPVELPTGEQKVTSVVNLTYLLK
jgi:uncharacterized protein YggE